MVRLAELVAEDIAPIADCRDSNRWRSKRQRHFIVWDGEGAMIEGYKKQCYVLFGCFDGESHFKISPKQVGRLSTLECLRFIIEIQEAQPDAWHVAFAFDYDANMIISDLSVRELEMLRKNNAVWYREYRIEYMPHKWFRVTKRRPLQGNITATIEDTFGFFQTSLVAALKKNIADHPDMAMLPEIEAGKDRRSTFTANDWRFIVKYWEIENRLFYALVGRLYENLYDERVNLPITKWFGPGALASFTYRTRGIAVHKADCGARIYDAARHAYAGGRFELFRAGRHTNVYGYDINSAYPNAIAQLPSLANGHWVYVESPKSIERFGVYHVEMRGFPVQKNPAPLFHRDQRGNISFSWTTDGWYWSPEVEQLVKHHASMGMSMSREGRYSFIEIKEGWVFRENDPTIRPFRFVADMYDERKRMKAEKVGAEMALKLCLNSLYGKMAQRAGWERNGKAPTWHQLEWAGWVTSLTRAMLFDLMWRIGFEKLIAVETDGLYTTATPEELGIINSKELGGWEVSHYDEMVYLQSGIYAKQEKGEWSSKYRGLDKNSLSTDDIRLHANAMLPNEDWPPVVGTTTRFIGFKAALFREAQGMGPMKVHHCKWETSEKEISVGVVGKRVHNSKLCVACKAGKTAAEMPHELVIRSASVLPDQMKSYPHDIPWLDKDAPEWRAVAEEMADTYV
jgi:hypothetical protein